MRGVFTCHKCNPKLTNFDYIYLKIHKKAKRQTPRMDLSLLNYDIIYF